MDENGSTPSPWSDLHRVLEWYLYFLDLFGSHSDKPSFCARFLNIMTSSREIYTPLSSSPGVKRLNHFGNLFQQDEHF